MFSDTDSTVLVTRYVKRVPQRDPVSGALVDARVALDWGIGAVDRGYNGVYIYGSPFQLFTQTGTGGIFGDPFADSRVLIVTEDLPLSTLPTAAGGGYGSDTVHFKLPNI